MSKRATIKALAKLLFAVCFITSRSVDADSYGKLDGIDVINYKFELSLSYDERRVNGSATITFAVRDGPSSLDLAVDFLGETVTAVRLDGAAADFERSGGKIRLRVSGRSGARTLEIDYTAYPRNGLYFARTPEGRKIIYSYNWPDQARQWLPVIDHPYDKATVETAFHVDFEGLVVSNGELVEQKRHPDGSTTFRWRTRVPIPTYGIAIAASHYAKVERPCHGITIAFYVYPADVDLAARHLDRTCAILKAYERAFGPYPYAKYAVVVAPITGGMENPSCTFVARSVLETEGEPGTIAHELAHEWFGNAVGINSWDHIWLSEGFATFAVALYGKETGTPDAFTAQIQRTQKKLQESKEHLKYPVIRSVDDPRKHLNAVVYQKGALILDALRRDAGESRFNEILRTYVSRYRHQSVSTKEFLGVVRDVAGSAVADQIASSLNTKGLHN